MEKSDDFRVRMFLFAVGLMAYGRKDVIPFVLQNMREIGDINRFSFIVLKLLPLPEEIRAMSKKNRDFRLAGNQLRKINLGQRKRSILFEEGLIKAILTRIIYVYNLLRS